MEITEVRVFLKDGNNKKLKAYATITIDNAFVVRNVKVIEGNKGLFVAMPSRKIKESCPKCNFKNTIRSKFCNQCGSSLPAPRRAVSMDDQGERQSEHKDIAHPISLECREYIQKKVLDAYEIESSNQPSVVRTEPVQDVIEKEVNIALNTSAAPDIERAPETSVADELEGDLEL